MSAPPPESRFSDPLTPEMCSVRTLLGGPEALWDLPGWGRSLCLLSGLLLSTLCGRDYDRSPACSSSGPPLRSEHSPGGPGLGLCASTAEATGSIPGGKTDPTSWAARSKQTNKNPLSLAG